MLSAVEVFSAFWGADWLATEAPLLTQVNDFFLYVLNSPLIDQLGEYSAPDTPLGHGSLAGTAVLTDDEPGVSVTDGQIKSLIQASMTKGALPRANANSLYFVFLPPGVDVELDGQKSCAGMCGYHESIGGSVYYAVVPYPGCSSCVGELHLLDALTSIASHELCEAITDPVPGQGWYDDANGEIGDICAWQPKKLGPWTVQREWSNQRGMCV